MKFTQILAGSAIASLALFTPLGDTVGLKFTPAAEAATSVSFSLFYNDLAKHGSWVRHRNDYVFVPARVRADWRPYVDGHWVYVDTYGWTWSSNEAFGWATYHYGRWGFDEDIGWYWVPGTRWAPAWVSWKRSSDYVVWAPLPPRGGDRGNDVDVSININVGDIPDFYWVAVPTREFLVTDVRRVVVRDTREVRRVVQRAEFIGTPRVRNNIVINTAIDINIIEKETGKKVRRVEARRTNDPREARAGDDQVTVFEGEVRAGKDEKPDRVREVSEVRKERRDRKNAGEDATQESTGSAEQASPDVTNDGAATGTAEDTATGNNTRKNTAKDQAAPDETTGQSASQPADETDASGKAATDETAPAKRKKKANEAAGQTKSDEGTSQSATGTEDETAPAQGNKKRKRAQQQAPDESKGSNAASQDIGKQQPANQQSRRKKAKDAGEADDATGSTSAPPEQSNQGKAKKQGKDRSKKSNCNPDDPNCQAAQ